MYQCNSLFYYQKALRESDRKRSAEPKATTKSEGKIDSTARVIGGSRDHSLIVSKSQFQLQKADFEIQD